MRISAGILLGFALLISGCSNKSADQANDFAVSPGSAENAKPDSRAAATDASDADVIPMSKPRIAYSYEYGFRVATDKVSELQRKHVELCDQQGPQVCHVLEMRQSGTEGDYITASLKIEVAVTKARDFERRLAQLAGQSGGREIQSSITGEDLSKQMVDTDARLRARILLRDRLMQILATHKGSVTDLVAAERGVADVNEEIDRARSELAEMNGRVDFSQIAITYESGSRTAGGFLGPIRAVFSSAPAILGLILATMIGFAIILIPLAIGVWAARRLGMPFPKRNRRQEKDVAGA